MRDPAVPAAAVHVVLPAGIDDPAAPSGGNVYDRRVCDGLRRTRDVDEILVADPDGPARRALAGALAGLPDGATVLLDGLIGAAVPDILEPHRHRLRLVVLVHLPLGDETGLSAAEAARLTALERRSLHAAAAVITTSAAAARRVLDLHRLPPARVHVATPGVDPAPQAVPADAGDRLLCVAAVTPRKGQDVLVDALSACRDLSWSCVFVGALDRAPEFADQVRAAGRNLAARTGFVRFDGPLVGAALDAAYAGADLCVLPSRAETYGMVVTEALARGIPVLGTAVDGVPEALGAAPGGARPGLLVPPGDPDALAAALRRWLTDPAWRSALRTAARARRTVLPGWDQTVRQVSAVLASSASPMPTAGEADHDQTADQPGRHQTADQAGRHQTADQAGPNQAAGRAEHSQGERA